MPGGTGKLTQDDPAAQVQRTKLVAEALKLREQGLTYQQIGDRQGCGKRTAQRRVERGLLKIVQEPAESVKKLELERLDRMLEGLTRDARYDDDGNLVAGGAFDGEPKAVLAALKILERRAKYLGLDAPEKKDVTLKSGATPAEARRVMQELFGDHVRPPVAAGEAEVVSDGLGPPEGAATH